MSGHFVFGKPVLFAFSLGLTTPYSLGILVWKFYQTFFHCVYWVLSDIWAPNSSHKIFTICFLHHCQGWKEGSFVCETAWFFPMHILICLTWNWSRFVPNSVKILTWNFRKKTILGKFFRIFVQTKAILYQNFWNLAILSAILFRVRFALKKFT